MGYQRRVHGEFNLIQNGKRNGQALLPMYLPSKTGTCDSQGYLFPGPFLFQKMG